MELSKKRWILGKFPVVNQHGRREERKLWSSRIHISRPDRQIICPSRRFVGLASNVKTLLYRDTLHSRLPRNIYGLQAPCSLLQKWISILASPKKWDMLVTWLCAVNYNNNSESYEKLSKMFSFTYLKYSLFCLLLPHFDCKSLASVALTF